MRKQSCRYVNRRSKSASSSLSSTPPPPPPHWEGSASHREHLFTSTHRFGQPPGFCASALQRRHTHTHTQRVVSRAEVDSPLFKCQSARSCSRPPVLDHITSSALPARLGARWRPSCAFSLRQRIPELRGAVELLSTHSRLANQGPGRRTLRAARGRNHNKCTGVILQLR